MSTAITRSFFLPRRPPPRPTLFPYTTLFRSRPPPPGRQGGPRRTPRHGRRSADLLDRKSTRLNSSHTVISYAVFCLKKKKGNSKGARLRYTRGQHFHLQGLRAVVCA